ncbi:MAG: shikimate kinase [Clostridia bacterium]|nr:shikimate kinase [Clostridia bacterium]
MAGIYGLLGEKLGHTFSPMIHGMLAAYVYGIYEKKPEELNDFLTERTFDGLNVTIPYKKTVMPYLAQISDKAKAIGCVNTVKKLADGSLYGDNTDYDGFLHLIKKLGGSLAGKKALVLGSGGGSLTAQTVLREQGAAEVIVVSRSGPVNYQNVYERTDAKWIVNTTPVGMYPNNGVSPLDLKPFTQCEAVVDIVYNPAKTQILLDAEALGIPCINGLPMLVAQAKRACEIFTDTVLPDECIDTITQAIERQTKNIILIGMPGCGKTSVGQALAALTGRKAMDVDLYIQEKIGCDIPTFFREQGEAAFREVETQVLAELCKQSGVVISTGGGVVTMPRNRDILRQNGVIVMIDRPMEDLPVAGRPVSQSKSVEVLAKERMPLYRAWSSFCVDNRGIEETARTIKEELGL